MRFKRLPQDDVSVDLVPLIDVLFSLLVFFILTTTFASPTRAKTVSQQPPPELDVPKSISRRPTPPKYPQVVVEITANGGIRFQGDQVSLHGLRARIRREQQSKEGVAVELHVSGSAPSNAFFQTYAACVEVVGGSNVSVKPAQ